MSSAKPTDALAASYFCVQLDGLSTAAFREISGTGSKNDVVVQAQVNNDGKATYVKVPGTLSWPNLVIKKGIDTDLSLWTWRNTIVTKGVDGQRKNGRIWVVDVTGAQKATWKILNAWPCGYVVGAMMPDTNEVLLEELHLTHEGIERIK
jgi:phage tail-like protein